MACGKPYDNVANDLAGKTGTPKNVGSAVQQSLAAPNMGGIKISYVCPGCNAKLNLAAGTDVCPKCGTKLKSTSASELGMPQLTVPDLATPEIQAVSQISPAVYWYNKDADKNAFDPKALVPMKPTTNMTGQKINVGSHLTVETNKKSMNIEPNDIPKDFNGNPMDVPSISSMRNRYVSSFDPSPEFLNALDMEINGQGTMVGQDSNGFTAFALIPGDKKDQISPIGSIAMSPDGRYNVLYCHADVDSCPGKTDPAFLCKHKQVAIMNLLADKNTANRLIKDWGSYDEKKYPEFKAMSASLHYTRHVMDRLAGNGGEVEDFNQILKALSNLEPEDANTLMFAMDLSVKNLTTPQTAGKPAFMSGGDMLGMNERCPDCGQFKSLNGFHNCPAANKVEDATDSFEDNGQSKDDDLNFKMSEEVDPFDYTINTVVEDKKLRYYNQFALQKVVDSLITASGINPQDAGNYPLIYTLQKFFDNLQTEKRDNLQPAISGEFVLPSRYQGSKEARDRDLRRLAKKMPGNEENNFKYLSDMYRQTQAAEMNWDLNYPATNQALTQVMTYLADIWGRKEKTNLTDRSFFLVGDPGVGKSESAKILGMILQEPVVKINISEVDPQELTVKASLDKEGRKDVPARIVSALITGSVILLDELPNAQDEMFNRIISLMDQGYVEVDGERWPISERTVIWATGNYRNSGSNVKSVPQPIKDRMKNILISPLDVKGGTNFVEGLLHTCRVNSVTSKDGGYKLPDGNEFSYALGQKLGEWYSKSLNNKENFIPGTRQMRVVLDTVARNGLNPRKLMPALNSLMGSMVTGINSDQTPTEGQELVLSVIDNFCQAFAETAANSRTQSKDKVLTLTQTIASDAKAAFSAYVGR